MLTKYGVWDTWDDFSFFTTKKRSWDSIRLKSVPLVCETSRDVSPNIVWCIQSMIFMCHHKVTRRTCGPKLPQSVFSSPNSPERVLNGIPQMSGTPWIKDYLGLEKSMVTKYGVWDTWDDFSFFTPKKMTCYVPVRAGTYWYMVRVLRRLETSHRTLYLYKAGFSCVVTKWSKEHVVLNCLKTFSAHQIGLKKF